MLRAGVTGQEAIHSLDLAARFSESVSEDPTRLLAPSRPYEIDPLFVFTGFWLRVRADCRGNRHPAAGSKYTLRGYKLRFLYPHPGPLPEGEGDARNRNSWPHAV